MNDKKKILFWGGKSKAKILNNMLNRQGEELSYIYDKFTGCNSCSKTHQAHVITSNK